MVGGLDSRWLYLGLVALVGVERLVELRISKTHQALALAQGGREYGQGHYPFMASLHTAFLLSAPLEVLLLDRPFIPWLGWPMLVATCATMALRYWVIATLGPRWNTRVIIVPSWKPATGGPYRWLRHPNYLGVIVELAALPLVHGAWLTALVFSLANLLLLRTRLKVEERALKGWTGYERAFGRSPEQAEE